MRRRTVLLALAAGVFCSIGATAQETLITNFDDVPEVFSGNANGTVMFRQPTFSGSTSAFIDFPTGSTNPNHSIISTDFAHSGTQSLMAHWQFKNPMGTNSWVRLTTFNALKLPNTGILFTHKLKFWVYVPTGTPDFAITLGVRETGLGDPIGGNAGTTQLGGAAAGIEWIGATSITTAPAAPTGKEIRVKDQWVEVVFDIPNENVNGFAGATANSVLDTDSGSLEHLAFRPLGEANNEWGPYLLYLDDFAQAPSGIVGDTDGSGCVDDGDITNVILDFGAPESGNNGNTDVDDSGGDVDDADLTIVILNFGNGC